MPTPTKFRNLLITTFRGLGLSFLFGVGALVILCGGTYVFYWWEQSSWRVSALSRLANAEQADAMVQSELSQIKVPTSESYPGSWVGRYVIKMTNGEHLVYEYWHRKALVADLLLARGSDGRWYSGNDHYCNDMAMIRFFPPSSSIAEFASKYSLHEFDGPKQTKAQ
ncbi:hypothetical protein [Brevifollis gellanilyticus]|uniref:Uncharacterized protein n=1 Tax=Brevifollis gellanilyticus TaxID=748831 RepID=A0A512M5N9_9BACT|nr:hypothetical protein [Brevifollis gellanilyticus]GEP42044.1 hypothetical protein BGE01nite_13350 [Brevifollis gellanilyticus]